MSQFIPVELHHASRLLNHGPTVMITSFDEQSQRRNIKAAHRVLSHIPNMATLSYRRLYL